MEVLLAGHLDDPEDGFGLQQAVLEEVGDGRRRPAALAWSSGRYVAATRLETRNAGFGRAVSLAAEFGFPTFVRNSGGGAVAANAGSLSFSLTFPVEDLRRGLYERYADLSALIVAALKRLGVAAEPGEVEGAFCPGTYSVRVGGPRGIKVAGLAQRVTRRAARAEALVLVNETAGLVPVLRSFYEALGLPFRDGSVEDLPVSVADVTRALAEEVEARYGAAPGEVGTGTMQRARALRGTWRPPALF